MTGTLNKILIIGYLGADPDIRVTKDGLEVARFTVATNERFADKKGERQERTEWHRVVVFGEGMIRRRIRPYLKRGSSVFIEGSVRSNTYTDNGGVERTSTDVVAGEVILLDRKPEEN